jgi:hypothetical protein
VRRRSARPRSAAADRERRLPRAPASIRATASPNSAQAAVLDGLRPPSHRPAPGAKSHHVATFALQAPKHGRPMIAPEAAPSQTTPFGAHAAATLLLAELAGPKRNSPARHSRPATRLRLRESSSELMIDRLLASRAVRMQLAGPACLGKPPPAAIVQERVWTHATSSRVADPCRCSWGRLTPRAFKVWSRKRCWSRTSPSASR